MPEIHQIVVQTYEKIVIFFVKTDIKTKLTVKQNRREPSECCEEVADNHKIVEM